MKKLSQTCIAFLLGCPAIYEGAMLAGSTPEEAIIAVAITTIVFIARTTVVDVAAAATAALAAATAAFDDGVVAATATAAIVIDVFDISAVAIIVTATAAFVIAAITRKEGVSLKKALLFPTIEGAGIFLALLAGPWWLALVAALILYLLGRRWEKPVALSS